MDAVNHNPYQQNLFQDDFEVDHFNGNSSVTMSTFSNATLIPDSPKPVPPPRGSSASSIPPNITRRRPAPAPPAEASPETSISPCELSSPGTASKTGLTTPDTPEFPSEWDFPPLSSAPTLVTPSNFSRTRSLCFRRKKKNGLDPEANNKASTVPRRKFMTDSDPDLRAHFPGDHSLNISNSTNYYENDTMSRSPRFEPVPAIMDEENVADITEKIITNINDHLERFEKGQNGELERDNKHLNRDNAMLREKIRMLEELLRENEAKADRKLTEEQSQSRKFILQVEKERRAEIQNLQFRLQHLEKLNQDHEVVHQRLSSLVENLKKESSEVNREITMTRDTNRSLQQEINEARDKLTRTMSRVDRGDMAQKMFISEINSSLLELEHILKDISSKELYADSNGSPNPLDSNAKIADLKQVEDLELIDPKEYLLKLKELVIKIREEKRDLKNQKEELMHNIMDRRFSGITNASDMDIGFGTINGYGDRSRSGSNNLEKEISYTHENNGSNNGPGQKSDAENTTLRMARIEKENNRLKTYIDKLLLIILETQPSLLEIKSCSTSPERSTSPP